MKNIKRNTYAILKKDQGFEILNFVTYEKGFRVTNLTLDVNITSHNSSGHPPDISKFSTYAVKHDYPSIIPSQLNTLQQFKKNNSCQDKLMS